MRVFLSYRRNDVGGYAGRLTDALLDRLGANSVFHDVSAIAPGQNFTVAIDRALDECDALLAVIGPGWLRSADPSGNPRLFDADDYVRLELARALERDVRVVPVLVGGAPLPAASALPEEIRELVQRQGVELHDETWHQDVDGLVRSLRGEPVVPIRKNRRRMIVGAGAVALAILGAAMWWWWGTDREPAASSASAHRRIPASEDHFEPCSPPGGEEWSSIQIDGDPTGELNVGAESLSLTVKEAYWRALEPGKWMVSLDTEMMNDTRTDLGHGSWLYDYLVVGGRQFELDPGGCFSAEPAFVKPGLIGDARAGFEVMCEPVGAIELKLPDEGETSNDDGITLTATSEPGEC